MSNILLNGQGSEKLTVSSSSIGLASIPSAGKRATIRVTGDAIHIENDGGAATTNDFLIRAEEVVHFTDNRFNLTKLRFIRNSGDAVLYITYFN